jgi:hypothetical protein
MTPLPTRRPTGWCSPGPSPAESKMTSVVGRSVGSGGLWEGFEGDLVAEAFELFDEPAAVAFGVLGVAAMLGPTACSYPGPDEHLAGFIAWALSRVGMSARVIACRIVASLVIQYLVYIGAVLSAPSSASR